MEHDLDALIDEIEASKPEASQFADRLIAEEKATNENTQPAPLQSAPIGGADSDTDFDEVSGEKFNAEIHCVDEQGRPRLNKDGSFRKRKRRRAGASNGELVDTSAASRELEFQNCAALTVQTIIICGYAIGGDEWAAQDQEKFAMVEAWKAYYRAKGILDLPPWLGVAIATGAYAMPRFSKPVTRSRLAAVWSGVKSAAERVAKWFGFSGSR